MMTENEAIEILKSRFTLNTSIEGTATVETGAYGAMMVATLRGSPSPCPGPQYFAVIRWSPEGARMASEVTIREIATGVEVFDWTESRRPHDPMPEIEVVANDVVREAMANIVYRLFAVEIRDANSEAQHADE